MLEAFSVATITILAVISPGADFAMVTRNSMVLSRRAGLLTAVGISLGVLVHVAYSMAGIGLLISRSILLFNALKLAGAAYLVYLGVTMAKSAPGLITARMVMVATLKASSMPAPQRAATTAISTRMSGWASRVSTQARAGAVSSGTQASQTAFLPA